MPLKDPLQGIGNNNWKDKNWQKTIHRLPNGIQSNLCTTVILGKWQGDRYIQVNFAENIRQLKILGSCQVTVICRVTAIYKAVIYRLDCNSPNHLIAWSAFSFSSCKWQLPPSLPQARMTKCPFVKIFHSIQPWTLFVFELFVRRLFLKMRLLVTFFSHVLIWTASTTHASSLRTQPTCK